MQGPERGSSTRAADVALSGLFVLAIALPLGLPCLGLDFNQLKENRVRAARPALKLERKSLARFPRQFETYFNDSFGLRDQLIRWNSLVRVAVLGVSSSPRVVIGKRNWLYYTSGRAADDLRHRNPLTPGELEQWASALEQRRDWLARQGIRYLVMLAPEKHAIYPELYPVQYRPTGPDARIDQFYDYLRTHTRLELLDLRPPLLEAKPQGRLFYRRDTHWNDRGAFVGYQAIVKALARWYPSLSPAPRGAFQAVPYSHPSPDLALMLGLGDMMPDHDYHLVPKFAPRAHQADPGPGLSLAPGADPLFSPVAMETGDPGLPRAVFFRDSFTIALMPFLSEHFSRVLYIWHRPFDPAIVAREHPDVVVEEAVQRSLWNPPPGSGIPDALIARQNEGRGVETR